MNTPSEPTTPPAGKASTPPIPAVAPHRAHLQAEGQTARISIHPPLDVGALAELAHLLEAWNEPPALKALVLDLTSCASAESASARGGAESRQGRVRERALTVAQERALAAL